MWIRIRFQVLCSNSGQIFTCFSLFSNSLFLIWKKNSKTRNKTLLIGSKHTQLRMVHNHSWKAGDGGDYLIYLQFTVSYLNMIKYRCRPVITEYSSLKVLKNDIKSSGHFIVTGSGSRKATIHAHPDRKHRGESLWPRNQCCGSMTF